MEYLAQYLPAAGEVNSADVPEAPQALSPSPTATVSRPETRVRPAGADGEDGACG
jgi:hypothetical protein